MDATQAQAALWLPLLFNAIKAVAVLAAGWWLAGFVSAIVRRRVSETDAIDETLGRFFASLVRYGILAVVGIAVLQMFGIQATSLVAVLGAATLAIGLALQGTLSHLAAGVMLIMFRPYKVSDYVSIAGTEGTVNEITLFTTELNTVDNVRIIVPNGEAWGSVITNYSANPTRRLDITFGIDYADDIDKAVDIIFSTIKADGRFLDAPAKPWVNVVSLGESSVDIQMRAWVVAGDYWNAKFAMLKNTKLAFDRAGISIPYPHQVHVEKAA